MFILSLLENPIKTLGFILGLLIAVTVHEFMHAFVADRLGDPTAKFQGRLSLNPLNHLDVWGTIFLLMIGLGWGRPVPINPDNFENPRLGELFTSLAGPLSNFLVAAIFAGLLRLFPDSLAPFFVLIVQINLVLCTFNLLPLPPLDGSKILWAIFPQIDIVAFEQTGIYILFAILAFSYISGYPILESIISPIVSFLANLLRVPNILF